MNLNVKFGELSPTFRVDFSETEHPLSASFGEVVVITTLPQDIEVYNEDYVVVPKTNEQALKTARKFMRDDVTVRAIPYFDVSNDAGGNTIYIGSEVLVDGN